MARKKKESEDKTPEKKEPEWRTDPALRPGAIAQSPGREAALWRASLPKPCPASSVRAREGAGCGSVGAVSGA